MFILIIAGSSLMLIGFTLAASGSDSLIATLIATVGVVMLVIGVPGVHRVGKVQVAAATAFGKTGHDLFLALQSDADPFVSQPNLGGRVIFLKDLQTVVIAQSGKAATGSGGTSYVGKSIPLDSKDPTIDLTGNLSADSKNWCFSLTTSDPQVPSVPLEGLNAPLPIGLSR